MHGIWLPLSLSHFPHQIESLARIEFHSKTVYRYWDVYLYGINTAGGMYADFDSSNAERNRETVHFNFPKHAHNNGNAYFGFFFSSHLLIDIVIIIRGRIPQYTNNSKWIAHLYPYESHGKYAAKLKRGDRKKNCELFKTRWIVTSKPIFFVYGAKKKNVYRMELNCDCYYHIWIWRDEQANMTKATDR